MNPSAYPPVHTATNTRSYTSIGDYYDSTQSCHPCGDYSSSLHHDPSCSTEVWSGQSFALGAWSDGDRALFEAFLTAEVASTSPSSPCAIVPMQSPPSYDQEPHSLHHPTRLPSPHDEQFNGSLHYPYATSSSRSIVSPTFKQAPPETAASYISPALISPLLHYVYDSQDDCLTAATPEPSCASYHIGHRSPSSSPHSFPSPEPSHASPQSSRATHRGSSSSSTSHSPAPSPRTSSAIIASHRRNPPAHTAAPAPLQTWQCPYCPYVQRNRRSPDLKRHIKTHTRGSDVADWVCCGVPVLNAIEFGVPPTTVREAQVFEFDGVPMIAGCRKAFSRRDALIRHLQREKGKCFGDAQSLYQRGNRESC